MVKALKNSDRHRGLPYTAIDVSAKITSGHQKWVVFTVLIAIYGFMKNISPESPYMAEYFVGSLNFTTTQVTQDIYPVSVYASVLQTFIVLLVTDILRYKPVIIVGSLGFFLHKVLLVWGHTLLEMQGNQFFWGTSKACSLAYKTYIYSKVDREHYQIVTAIIRIAPKAGTLFSSILSQVALSIFLLKIEHLNKISLVASLMALVSALLLPSLQHSLYFSSDKLPQPQNNTPEERNTYTNAVRLLWQDFKDAYTNPNIIKWCIWWILATGGFQQVTDYYVQVLWSEISHVHQNKYNGGVEAVYTVVSAIVCYFIGSWNVNWHSRGELILGICTLLKGTSLLYGAVTQSILVSYVIYVTFCSMYDSMMVISNSEVAKHLKNESFALIFGINTFLALVCQSLLTYLLSSKYVFALHIREQFIGIGCGFLILGLGFLIKAVFKLCYSPEIAPVQKTNEITPIVTPLQKSRRRHSNPS